MTKHSKKPRPVTPKGPVVSEEQIKLMARDQIWCLFERFMQNHCVPLGPETFAWRVRAWAETVERMGAQIKAMTEDKATFSVTNDNPREDEPTQLELPFSEEPVQADDSDFVS